MADEAEKPAENPTDYETFMASVISLDGKSLIADLRKAETEFPELITAFTYLSIHAAASVIAGNTFRRGNLLADCGPAVAELAITAANSVVKSPDLAKSAISRINAHYIQAAMEKSMEEGHVVTPTVVKVSEF
ncbi:hypothetical protein ACIQKE_03800 [Streptomyces griseoviridis]|uniref:Uncharacterized protein n=2 Tax=Streptomyces TaxID=1883 RepID=A0A3S9Z7E7_STRGD|nr:MULTISPECIES: hypothetical protein [Streptomyces]AZS83662.1 hypothetical protein ELQ87_04635 [Streptomyces griseoviridis]MDH6696476.1 hypothetical protein [Streptomyces sp. MAA16]MDT0473242.1 hypothetical protein [Streptomyces sp. DSM 41014]QCN89482.1 hypothetical protein DDJ31_34720 [Streptomyces griseoviridis]